MIFHLGKRCTIIFGPGTNAGYGKQLWTKSIQCIEKKDRTASPSYGIIDSQSVKTQYPSEARGIDGHKKVKGHKRHIVVDILGNLLAVVVHAAHESDTTAGCPVLAKASQKHTTLEAFWGDQGYHGTAT